MKKIVCLGILAIICSLPAMMPQRAWAQDYSAYHSPEQKPPTTAPGYIAMLFYKLAGKAPDFESWARNTAEYQAAVSFDKAPVLDKQVQTLKNIYSLLTVQEPLIVETPVRLSEYSVLNKGFFVVSFREDTFFSARYNDQSYAIVPIGIMDRQWLKVPDTAVAETIKAAARGEKDRALTMMLALSPKYADASAPAMLYGEKHWLISAEVKKMTLYSAGSAVPLWRSDEVGVNDAKQQELLKLRQ